MNIPILLIMSSMLSTIVLMKREGIKEISSWKTGVICVLVIPLMVFAIAAAVMYAAMVYD